MFWHCVNGSTCGDLVPPSLHPRQRALDGLPWPLGYLTDGAVPSPAPNLHSVHRNDSLKSAQARPAERTPSATRAAVNVFLSPSLISMLGPFIKFLSLSSNVEFQCFSLWMIGCYCHSWAKGNALWIRGSVSFLFLNLNAVARILSLFLEFGSFIFGKVRYTLLEWQSYLYL